MTLPPCELVLADCCDRRFKGSMGASAPKLPRWRLPARVGTSATSAIFRQCDDQQRKFRVRIASPQLSQRAPEA
jgi:hypothetical protein